eukprot:CAMPEP_0167806720 /NCGR_PEP_ID=MMETSP0111_2-20121227/22027_1 /TAXON_ID=91324 /ORGANISM="Lotharella globosa, Strain CCCM811" /LENGTH=82 /DNA_ID=CAMNT_0007704289 /DNA_START=381 /DNA_END=629 /DNA_ORIENTATION=+
MVMQPRVAPYYLFPIHVHQHKLPHAGIDPHLRDAIQRAPSHTSARFGGASRGPQGGRRVGLVQDPTGGVVQRHAGLIIEAGL